MEIVKYKKKKNNNNHFGFLAIILFKSNLNHTFDLDTQYLKKTIYNNLKDFFC